jgi:hypothetical protein
VKHQRYIVENLDGKVVKSFNKQSDAESFAHNKGYFVVLNKNTKDDRQSKREAKRNGGMYE